MSESISGTAGTSLGLTPIAASTGPTRGGSRHYNRHPLIGGGRDSRPGLEDKTMQTLGQILAGLGGLIALICHIIVIVKMFQNGQTGLGILAIVLTCCFGIGILFTLIYGWVKSTEWNIKNIMLVYTVGFVLHLAGEVMAPPDVASIRQQIEQMQQQKP
jgi:hypothetical protein